MYDSEKEYQMMFERLKDICKQRNITNYALAKATNLSNSSIRIRLLFWTVALQLRWGSPYCLIIILCWEKE